MFLTLLKKKKKTSFNLLSANAMNSVKFKILSCGKEMEKKKKSGQLCKPTGKKKYPFYNQEVKQGCNY